MQERYKAANDGVFQYWKSSQYNLNRGIRVIELDKQEKCPCYITSRLYVTLSFRSADQIFATLAASAQRSGLDLLPEQERPMPRKIG